MVLDPTGKIARQVSWLNKNIALSEPISFTDVVDSLSCLSITEAMALLKEVEQKAAAIERQSSATHYIISAAETRLPLGGAPTSGGFLHMSVPTGGSGATHVPQVSVYVDPTGKIGRQVGWLNKNITLTELISYSDVVEPLSLIDVTMAMAILKELEQKGGEIHNPTQWICSAAANAVQRGGLSGVMMSEGSSSLPTVSASLDSTGKISRQVGWLNKHVDLAAPISFSDVVQQLSALDITVAMQILKDVEAQAANLRDPTGFVITAAEKAPRGPPVVGGAMLGGRASAHVDPTGKIKRQVQWLNKNLQLAEPLSFESVAEALSAIEIVSAMRILKDVEEQASGIHNPNSYIAAAADRLPRAPPPGLGPPVMPWGGGAPIGGRPLGAAAAPRTLVGKRTWSQAAATPADDGFGKQISREVGRINAHAPFTEKLSYSDIKPHLETLGLEAAMKILKDVEGSARTVKSPTSYVIAAAKRASSGEGIPAKRPAGSPAVGSPPVGGWG
mmetsp:Transcript_23209/g.65584  ORF Transcript_23209/g.65584 Transcript_23209/m.65584 type:complete len:503 (-) Transcript_23209:111-1619(-)